LKHQLGGASLEELLVVLSEHFHRRNTPSVHQYYGGHQADTEGPLEQPPTRPHPEKLFVAHPSSVIPDQSSTHGRQLPEEVGVDPTEQQHNKTQDYFRRKFTNTRRNPKIYFYVDGQVLKDLMMKRHTSSPGNSSLV
jgi:hypothetical protein